MPSSSDIDAAHISLGDYRAIIRDVTAARDAMVKSITNALSALAAIGEHDGEAECSLYPETALQDVRDGVQDSVGDALGALHEREAALQVWLGRYEREAA